MKVVRLGERYTTDYVPDELIEGYSSCIWTERAIDFGEFEIRTPKIEETLALLPEDTLISHLETDDVMVVETANVVTNDEGNQELLLKGRDFRKVLEDRFVESNYKKKRKMRRNYSATAGIGVLVWQAVDSASGKDVTRGESDSAFNGAPARNDYPWNTLDRIENVCVTDTVAADGGGVAQRWWLEQGLLYPQLLVIQAKYDIYIRMVRPHENSNGQVLTVRSFPIEERGIVDRVYTTDLTSMRFDLYKGLDRSHTQNVNDKVAFSTLQGDLDSAQYLWSSKDVKTHVELMSSVDMNDRYADGTSAYTGMRRRTTAVDVGEPDIPDAPEPPDKPGKNATQQEKTKYDEDHDDYIVKRNQWRVKRNNIMAEFKEDAVDMALAELKAKRRTVMLSGDISPLSPFVYRTHYGLGDIVSLHGDYGLVEKMVVSEFIRTENESGDTGIPGLVMP